MTALRDALKRWVETTGANPAEAEEVKIIGQFPAIEKLDNSLAQLVNCRKLSLSTNNIAQISNLGALTKLEILSMGRNLLKNLAGLDPVAGTLRELWISYNNIEKLAGIEKLKRLQVLYMSNNKVATWSEFERLRDLPDLEDLLMTNNPVQQHAGDDWRIEVIRRLPNLKRLDGYPVTGAERERALGAGGSVSA